MAARINECKFYSREREREATSTGPFRGIHGFDREGGKFARAVLLIKLTDCIARELSMSIDITEHYLSMDGLKLLLTTSLEL
ncbi:hypothetical protein AVEN_266894-1 [Araneus ventricosus]|uniref:Uncharacterized protein n=1 Tax=Araneus ventricosus TaxID=182803 RepID=A0A4Y2SKV0_ARAVE|nr:hypothetical protein AVEN_266894-1 [Araneus ventricosus]